jgi:hypothetical protein
MPANPEMLMKKIEALPVECIIEVEDFVDFIAARAQDRALIKAAADVSAPAFARVWDNSGDDVYNEL